MSVSDALTSTLATATAALSPAPGRSLLAPGESVAWDDCCDGQVWVRVARVEKARPTMPCDSGVVLTLGVGVVRCVHVLGEDGVAPTAAEITADASQTVADMVALYSALACSVPATAARAVVTSWAPLGPQGGCAGGEWEYRVELL